VNRRTLLLAVGVILLRNSVSADADNDDAKWAEGQLKDIEVAIVKAVPSKTEPLRKLLQEFKENRELKEAAIAKLRERAKQKGAKTVGDEIQKGTTEKKLQEINDMLKSGVKIEQIGFPWCLLWGCK